WLHRCIGGGVVATMRGPIHGRIAAQGENYQALNPATVIAAIAKPLRRSQPEFAAQKKRPGRETLNRCSGSRGRWHAMDATCSPRTAGSRSQELYDPEDRATIPQKQGRFRDGTPASHDASRRTKSAPVVAVPGWANCPLGGSRHKTPPRSLRRPDKNDP